MIDFENHLSALLDDVADSVHPRSDPDSVFRGTVTPVSPARHWFRPGFAAVAASVAVLLGGAAFAIDRVNTDSPRRIQPAATPVTDSVGTSTTTTIEVLTATTTNEDATPVSQPKKVSVKDAVIKPVVPAESGDSGDEPSKPTISPDQPTVPKTEATEPTEPAKEPEPTTPKPTEPPKEPEPTTPKPTEPPVGIKFSANLGLDGLANTPMTQGFYGTAEAGSAIRIGSDYGVAETTAGPNGTWDATLVMADVPPGTKVYVRITANTSEKVFEFKLYRPGEPAPPVIAFTANAALTTTDHSPPLNEYWGKATPGAVISITSEYGSAQVEANGEGKWAARVEFPAAPAGTTFNVHITSSKNDGAYDFALSVVAPG